jgi:hypothetical protein
MFMATATLQNIFAVGVLGYDQLTNAKLNLLMIPGIVAAGIVAIIWFKRDKPVKMYIFSGFAAMLGYSIIMYFSWFWSLIMTTGIFFIPERFWNDSTVYFRLVLYA